MYLPNAKGQQSRHFLFDASRTICCWRNPAIATAESKSRAGLHLQQSVNRQSVAGIWRRAGAATLTSGVVTSLTITNAGFGYTFAPEVHIMGGGPGVGPPSRAAGFPDYPAPGEDIGMNFRTGDISWPARDSVGLETFSATVP
jgi:hypothetical protein